MNTSPSSKNQWQLQVQMHGTERSREGHTIATGELILIEPTGQQHRFPMRSGGFGRYGDRSMLPGLESDLTPNDSSSNARYRLNWNNLSYRDRHIRRDMAGPDGHGSWLALGSINTTRSHFGIHTDGPNVPASHAGDGTHGCIGLEPAIADAFFDTLMRIPAAQRPRMLAVLPPASAGANVTTTESIFSGTFDNGHTPTLSATLPRSTPATQRHV